MCGSGEAEGQKEAFSGICTGRSARQREQQFSRLGDQINSLGPRSWKLVDTETEVLSEDTPQFIQPHSSWK